MKEKIANFLNIGLILVSIFCVFVFITQTVCMNLMSGDAIRQLGVFYMSGISEQVAAHFGTTIELRLSQVESLVDSVPPGRYSSEAPMRIELTYNARSAGFDYLAFYTDDGNFRMIYGSQVTADLPEALRRSVLGGKYNVCAGKDAADTQIVLMGVPAVYPLDNGTSSIGLVAGLSTSYLRSTLDDNTKSGNMEYSIMRKDGSYILHNSSTELQNYFERVELLYETCNGKTPAQYAKELRDALETGQDYTSEVLISGESWTVYCTSLPNSEWFLLLKVPHNTVNETVNLLQRRWSYISIGGCSLIVCALLLVFVGYYHLTRAQMKALNEARKTAEQAQLSAERSNRAKNEFLSNISHDIRTPMNGIMGMTSIAIDSLDNPARVRSCLKKIHVSSRHLLGLISDMLDMSKIESENFTLNMEPLSLREIMQNIMTIIQLPIQEKNQHFSIYIHDIRHENVCSDRVRLSQILLNILGNAMKFTPEGGTIEISLYEEASPKGDEYIRSLLEIRDNGIGMSQEFQGRIFEAFAREDNARIDKAAGAGMGMAITKYIVDAMGGTITVESEQGKGSCFRIVLDMEKTTLQEKELCLPDRNILVVEDNPEVGALTVSALESIGLRAQSVTDLGQARRLLEERHNGSPCHIVLLDADVYGQDAGQDVRELSGRFSPPVILFADGEWDEQEAAAKDSGICGFIQKPLFRSSLYYGLRPFLEKTPPQQEPEPAPEQEPGADLRGKRILIAEDNELNWEIACELLGELGLESEWAENGRICVEKFAASAPGWYDAILMDLRMPVMTGFEATAAIRALDREDAKTIPIIAVSADAFQEDVRKCLDCGMNAHTAKPLDSQEFFSMLQQYLCRDH